MSTNKHALIRYRVIDRCLRQVDKAWNWKTLAEACASEIEMVMDKKITLSERTIKQDLKNMRSDNALGYHAPIEYDRLEKSYYYSDRKYSITEAPLNRSDSDELKNAISLLRQFTGFQHLEGIENIIQKLELLAFESTTKSKRIVHLEQPSLIPGQKWLDKLYGAIKDEVALTIEYKPFGKDSETIIISPHLLKEYDNRWYLYANNHKKGLRTYGLERIENISETLQPYKTVENFDPDAYFHDIVGITLQADKKIEKVTIQVYGLTKNYIRTKPLHHTQRELEDGIFQLTLVPNFELESLLLSYGENLKVISPQSLCDTLAQRAGALYKVYNK